MKRSELSSRVAVRASLSKGAANAVVAPCSRVSQTPLRGGETVAIAGLGTFTVRTRAAREGRNPATGAHITIPASKVVSFKAAKALREAVR